MDRFLEQRNGISFLECLEQCLVNRDLVKEWERLSGKKLFSTHPLDQMIDEATGYDLALMREFADFCYTSVFTVF